MEQEKFKFQNKNPFPECEFYDLKSLSLLIYHKLQLSPRPKNKPCFEKVIENHPGIELKKAMCKASALTVLLALQLLK